MYLASKEKVWGKAKLALRRHFLPRRHDEHHEKRGASHAIFTIFPPGTSQSARLEA
jgi:hypothetical protein